jgi:hypothetical protein
MNEQTLNERLQPRSCVARTITSFDREDINRRLYSQQETHGDFRIAEQVAMPSAETWFDVACDGETLFVSVLYFEAGEYFGTGVQRPNEIGAGNHGVEVLIAPCGDQLGYLQFGAGPNENKWSNSFWPYLDGRADLPAGLKWDVEFSFENLHADLAWIVYYHLPLSSIRLPGYGGPLGFNVMRCQLRHDENAAWNACSGSGFSDGTSCGWLSLNDPVEAPELALTPSTTVALHGTYDWPDNMVGGPYAPETIRHELRFLKAHGMTRVYFLDYPGRERPFLFDNPGKLQQYADHYRATIDAFGGDIMTGVCRIARDEGLEFFTICKPYDLGISDGFPVEHPELAFRRNPAWTREWTGETVTQLTLYADNDAPLSFDPAGIRVFLSADNLHYRFGGDCNATDDVVERAVYRHSPAGKSDTCTRERVRRIVLRDLAIDARYAAIVLPDAASPGAFGNREFLLAEAALPLELARFPQQPWQTSGFAFELDTHAAVWSDQDEYCVQRRELRAGSVLGLRFGHEPYLAGMLDPGHADVRQFWIDTWIQRAIDAGADGVDIRIAHHHLCTDWPAYAYAEPVLLAFQERMGRAPEAADHTLIQQIRGDFHTQFLREAKAALSAAGKKLEAHVEARMKPKPEHRAYTGIYWDVATWIEEGILDGINLKYVCPVNPWLQREILPKARKAGIPVHAISAIGDPRSQPRTAEWAVEWLRMCRAGGLHALNLYELWVYLRTTPRGEWFPRGSSRAIFTALKEVLDA